MSQPHCRWCGKKIAKQIRHVWIRKVSDRTDPSLNDPNETPFGKEIKVPEYPKNRAECESLTDREITSVKWYVDRTQIRAFYDWDGKSYKDPFFCTNTCAMNMGYSAAHNHGLVTDAWKKATSN